LEGSTVNFGDNKSHSSPVKVRHADTRASICHSSIASIPVLDSADVPGLLVTDIETQAHPAVYSDSDVREMSETHNFACKKINFPDLALYNPRFILPPRAPEQNPEHTKNGSRLAAWIDTRFLGRSLKSYELKSWILKWLRHE
jgi:hypothetical protein